MRANRVLMVVGALLLGLIAYLLFQRGTSADGGEFRIGVVLSLTGRGSTYGQRALHGMQLAVEDLNSTEPHQKRPIRLIIEDSESSATRALSALQKLTSVDRVPVAVGFVLSDEVLATAPLANERAIVLMSTAAGSDEIRQAGDFVFRNREGAELQARTIADAVRDLRFDSVAILHSQSANGISYRDKFQEAARAAGIAVGPVIGFTEGKNDYRAEIEQVRRTSPRAVYLAGLDQELGLILRQASELGFRPQFFASPGALSPKLLEIAGSAAEGLVSASAAFDPQSRDPRVRSFAQRYQARFGEEPDFISANSYDAIILVAGMMLDGAQTGAAIRDRLYQTRNYPGIGGNTTFDADGEVSKPITLVRVHNGDFSRIREAADTSKAEQRASSP